MAASELVLCIARGMFVYRKKDAELAWDGEGEGAGMPRGFREPCLVDAGGYRVGLQCGPVGSGNGVLFTLRTRSMLVDEGDERSRYGRKILTASTYHARVTTRLLPDLLS